MQNEIESTSALLGSSAEKACLPSEAWAEAQAVRTGPAQEVTESTHDNLQHGFGDVLPLHYGLEKRKRPSESCHHLTQERFQTRN